MDSKQIAAARGWQTLADGLIVVVIVAGVAPLIGAIQSGESWRAWLAGWETWTWSAFQAAVVAGGTALVAWLRRRFVDVAESTARRAEG